MLRYKKHKTKFCEIVASLVTYLYICYFRIRDTENAIYLRQKHNEMLGYLNQLEDRQFKQWCTTVPSICKTHLAKNLIYRDPPFVRNNFSPEVCIFIKNFV